MPEFMVRAKHTAGGRRVMQSAIRKSKLTTIKTRFNQDDHSSAIHEMLDSPFGVNPARPPTPRILDRNNRVKRFQDLVGFSKQHRAGLSKLGLCNQYIAK